MVFYGMIRESQTENSLAVVGKEAGNMICSVKTLGISGINGSLITAECYISGGLPGFDIVGLPDAAVKEARERVRAAARSSGLRFPTGGQTAAGSQPAWQPGP